MILEMFYQILRQTAINTLQHYQMEYTSDGIFQLETVCHTTTATIKLLIEMNKIAKLLSKLQYCHVSIAKTGRWKQLETQCHMLTHLVISAHSSFNSLITDANVPTAFVPLLSEQLHNYIKLYEHSFEIHIVRIAHIHLRHMGTIEPSHMTFCHSAIVVVRDARAYVVESMQGIHTVRIKVYSVAHVATELCNQWTANKEEILYWVCPILIPFDIVSEFTKTRFLSEINSGDPV